MSSDPTTIEVRLDLGTPGRAAEALAALAPDDEGMVSMHLEGQALRVQATGGLMGALRSVDDVLGCLRAIGSP